METTTDLRSPETHTTRFRRRVTAASTVGFAGTLLLSDLIDPVGDGGPEGFWTAASTEEGTLVLSALLLLASSILLVPMASGVLALVRGRGAALVHAGSAMLVLGAFGHALLSTLYLLASIMPGAGIEREAMVGLLERTETSGNLAVAFPLILSFAVGLLLTFIGLRRAAIVPRWVLGVIVGAFLIELAGPGGAAVAVVKQGLLLAACVDLSRRLLDGGREIAG